jgi:hypothetical protein
MKCDQPHRGPRCRHTPLAASLAALFAVAAQPALATTWHVNACSDGYAGDVNTHIGSLRFAAVNAAGNDTIDLSSLQSCTISLTTGAVVLKQKNITLAGPGKDLLTIQQGFDVGAKIDRIIDHEGTGTLYINDLTIAFGHYESNSTFPHGGCIYSTGNAYLARTRVTSCTVAGTGQRAFGAGVYTRGDLTLNRSTIDMNTAYGHGAGASGGGADVNGILTTNYSTISENSAEDDLPAGQSSAGGAYAVGGAYIESSTISNNFVRGSGGGLVVGAFLGPVGTTSISNSTISSNQALQYIGGVSSIFNTTVTNSTIAFNTAGVAREGLPGSGRYRAPGMSVVAELFSVSATLTNSLFSNNTYGITAHENDFTFVNESAMVTLVGTKNLIRASTSGLPGDTLTGSCPLLGPLRNNGGPTWTHALLSTSVAIDAGSSTLHVVDDDQRGFGFPRVSGFFPDIGAYEVNQADAVFSNAFEGCPALGGGI